MASNTLSEEKARFDTRLPKKQKIFFEKAARLGGFRSLTDFVLSVVQEKASLIFRERELILASQKDSELFFNAIINADNPNEDLVSAAKHYNELISK